MRIDKNKESLTLLDATIFFSYLFIVKALRELISKCMYNFNLRLYYYSHFSWMELIFSNNTFSWIPSFISSSNQHLLNISVNLKSLNIKLNSSFLLVECENSCWLNTSSIYLRFVRLSSTPHIPVSSRSFW